MSTDDEIAAEIAAEHAEMAVAREEFLQSPGIGVEEWRTRLKDADLPAEAIPKILATARPAARLVATPVTAPLSCGSSKLGGAPDLPAGSTWPHKATEPLSFIAQLRLSEVPASVRAALHLPADGLLSFFYDNKEQPWGFDPKEDRGGWAVLFTPALDRLGSFPFPEQVDEEGRFSELRVRLVEELRLPAASSPSLDTVKLSDEALETYRWDMFHKEDGANDGVPSHYLGGHAQPIQDPPEWQAALTMNGVYTGDRVDRTPEIKKLEATATELRLLFQIDSDDLMNAMWGDTGRLYVWMYEDDLKAGAYERAWCQLQCG